MARDAENKPRVSVVIPAYNEAGCIGGCLKTLFEQTHPSFEVIVVDDGSKDGTARVVKKYPAKLIKGAHKGPGLARNLGASEANGDILAMLDADMEFHSQFLEKLVEPIEKGKAIGTFTKEEYVLNYENTWARYWNHICGIDDRRRIPADYPDESTVFRAILKEKFFEVGGYDDIGVGEDQTVSKKLGVLAAAAPGAVCYHRNPATLFEVFREARWYARGNFFSYLEKDAPYKRSFKVARRMADEFGEKRYYYFLLVFFWGLRKGFDDYHKGKSHVK